MKRVWLLMTVTTSIALAIPTLANAACRQQGSGDEGEVMAGLEERVQQMRHGTGLLFQGQMVCDRPQTPGDDEPPNGTKTGNGQEWRMPVPMIGEI